VADCALVLSVGLGPVSVLELGKLVRRALRHREHAGHDEATDAA
jgi:hypothetical protein